MENLARRAEVEYLAVLVFTYIVRMHGANALCA